MHKEKTNRCDNCGKYFSFASFLKIHLKSCKSSKKVSINDEIIGQKSNVDNVASSKNQETTKASRHEKEILESNQDKISREFVSKQDKDRTEVITNEEVFEFGNIEINIDDEVLEIYS